MMITIDPNELTAASATLHNCAAEAAAIGSQLWACSCCAMPADLQGLIDQLVVTIDRALDALAARLDAQAVDLTNRAQIAATDSMAAAGVVVESNTITGTTPGSIVYSTIGGPLSSVTIGGWVANGDVTITVPPLAQSPIAGGIGILPGDVSITNADGTPATTPIGPMIVGPPDYSQGPLRGIMALAGLLDRQGTVNSVVNSSASSAALAAAMSVQDSIYTNNMTFLSKSREQIEADHGVTWLPNDYIHDISPYTPL
ncbi:MAG TPA: hypothetical protein VFE86_10465 [Ilumatobacteraceae bacterium]|nr:hypothetical protein [Ilumatobacteraceae bacterium]